MISIKNIISLTVLPLIMFSFSQCSSQKSLQEKAPLQFNEAFCRNWVAGVKGGGAGINLFIPVAEIPADNTIIMDSVYFRGRSTKLKIVEGKTPLYAGYFITDANKSYDIEMNSDGKKEYGNKKPSIVEKIPFELKDNECVISYKDGSKTKYFKIKNVVEKSTEHYPMAPKQ